MSVPKRLEVSRALPKTIKKSTAKSLGKATGELSEYESYYAVIRKIPRGQIMTYGDVAKLAGRPTSARRVGYALFVVPGAAIPWWRVINARGQISQRHHSGPGGPEDEQRFRLLQEGIEFSSEGRVDLSRYRYTLKAKTHRATLGSR
jgi:methylated-DNA-protein-cysteine methyltransferase-like protein